MDPSTMVLLKKGVVRLRCCQVARINSITPGKSPGGTSGQVLGRRSAGVPYTSYT